MTTERYFDKEMGPQGDDPVPQWWYRLQVAAEALSDGGYPLNAEDVRFIADSLLDRAAAKREASTESAPHRTVGNSNDRPALAKYATLEDYRVAVEQYEASRCRAQGGNTSNEPLRNPEGLAGALTDEAKGLRDKVLEEAAQIAEWFGPSRPISSRNPGALIQGRWEGEQAASEGIAAAIRSRKSTAAIAAHTKAQEGK